MAGISQSMVSMYSGTYISPIRPRPVASAVCHLRFMRDSSRSRASPSRLVARAGGVGGTGVAAGARRCRGLVAGGGGVAGLDDGAGEVVELDEVRGVGDGGDLGGQVHPGVGDAVELEQRLLDASHARGAGHAADVERARLGSPRQRCCLPVSGRVPGVVSGEAVVVMPSSQGSVRSDAMRLSVSSVRPLSIRCATVDGAVPQAGFTG